MFTADESVIEPILEDLRRETDVFRTVLRLESPHETFPVLAEALGPGAETTRGPLPYDLLQVDTVKFLVDTRQILVQNDCYGEPKPPPSLMEEEGVGAQILAPLQREGRIIGILAAHHAGESRNWTVQDVVYIVRAMERIYEQLVAEAVVSST